MIDFVRRFGKIRINYISLQSKFKMVKNVITKKCYIDNSGTARNPCWLSKSQLFIGSEILFVIIDSNNLRIHGDLEIGNSVIMNIFFMKIYELVLFEIISNYHEIFQMTMIC